jgi:hypothetical protein
MEKVPSAWVANRGCVIIGVRADGFRRWKKGEAAERLGIPSRAMWRLTARGF